MKNIAIKLMVSLFGAAWILSFIWFILNLVIFISGGEYNGWSLISIIVSFIGMGVFLIEMDKFKK